MKILVVAHDSSMYGSSQSLVTALTGINSLIDRKIMVLLPYPGKIEEVLKSLGIEYEILPFPKCVEYKRKVPTLKNRFKRTYLYYKSFYNVLPKFVSITKAFSPDVIYSNTSVISIGYWVARKLKVPHVWHIREFGDVDYIYFPTKRSVTACIRKTERSIFGSEALRNAWLKRKTIESHVVYNGIFQDNLQTSPRELPLQYIRIGMLGGFIFGKGQDIAVEAFSIFAKQVENSCLTFYGDVMDKRYYHDLLSLIRKLGLESKVIMSGFVHDKESIFRNLDVMLNCSRTEGFGRTIVEAMAYGVPVIGNNSGGIPEIIEDKMDGLLFEGSAESLAHAMFTLFSDKKLYNSLSANGIKKAQKFSINKYVESIDRILFDGAKK